jgi:biotin carboxylase
MRILIIGHLRAAHGKLHAHGHQTVLFMPQDRIIPKDLSSPHEAVIALSADAPDAVSVEIAAVLHKTTPFDAVVCYSDQYQGLAYQVARRLEVFTLVDNDLLEKTSNKFRMRQAFDASDVPHCRYRFARGEAELREAVQALGFPCILKPVAGLGGSVGVARVEANGELERALAWVGEKDIATGVIVEEFLEGEEFSVEALSVEGHHHIFAVTKKYKDAKTFVELGHLVPAPIDGEAQAAIVSYVRQVLSALGFRDCPSHTELILTPRGPRIIETHTRLGGDKIVDLVLHATGIDLYDLVAKQSARMPIADDIPATIHYRCSAAIWFADPGHDDQFLESITGLDEARAIKNVKLVETLKEPGSRSAPVKNSDDRSAMAIAVGASAHEALATSRAAIRSLNFLYRWKLAPDDAAANLAPGTLA